MGADPGDQAWTRSAPARATREWIICGLIDPLVRAQTRRDVSGRDHLDDLAAPAIFVANHCSHLDTPLLLRSLPARWRHRTVVAAAADYFYSKQVLAGLVSLAFGTVPVRRGGIAGTEQMASLIAEGWSLVIFAEGTRSRDGRVAALRPGAAMLAAETGAPLIPVHVAGTHEAMPTGRYWMNLPRGKRHPLRVSFGAPIRVSADDDRLEVMDGVRAFMASCGAETTPDPKLDARRATKTA